MSIENFIQEMRDATRAVEGLDREVDGATQNLNNQDNSGGGVSGGFGSTGVSLPKSTSDSVPAPQETINTNIRRMESRIKGFAKKTIGNSLEDFASGRYATGFSGIVGAMPSITRQIGGLKVYTEARLSPFMKAAGDASQLGASLIRQGFQPSEGDMSIYLDDAIETNQIARESDDRIDKIIGEDILSQLELSPTILRVLGFVDREIISDPLAFGRDIHPGNVDFDPLSQEEVAEKVKGMLTQDPQTESLRIIKNFVSQNASDLEALANKVP